MTHVVLVDPARLRPPTLDPRGEQLVGLLNRSLRYQLLKWWPSQPGYENPRTWEPRYDPANPELGIRPATSVALAVAVALATGVYDPSTAGVTATEASRIATFLVDGVAKTHRANRAGGWGAVSQSPMWSAYAGLAGWLRWPRFGAIQRTRVERMVSSEADRLLTWRVPHYRDPVGVVVTPGDSKAEELSWSARILHLGAAMAPRHPRAGQWRDASIPLLVAAYSRHADLADHGRRVHGRPVCAWVGGSNVEADGTVTNHHRLHPSYMSFVHHGAAVLHALLAGRPVDEAALLNLDRLYGTLVDRRFASPPYDPPGGPIYRRDNASLYFPQGNDWRANGRVGALLLDVEADLWGLDRLASRPATWFADLHGAGVERMMARFTDGRVYAGRNEFDSPQREQDAAERFAQCWLATVVTANVDLVVADAPAADPANVKVACPDP